MAPKDTTAVPVTAATADKKKKDDAIKKKKEEEIADAMSDEDKELKERLETCVSTVLNDKEETTVTIPIRSNALDVIVNELRTATSSMTSVPKPLKFLRPHFGTVKELYLTMEKLTDMDNATVEFRARVADLLAVLAMTMGKHGTSLYVVRVPYCRLYTVDCLLSLKS
jgi:26S proteasome regulatory subunit N1